MHAPQALALERRQFNREDVDNLRGNVVLQSQQIGAWRVIRACPDSNPIGRADELQTDAIRPRARLNRADEHVVDAERSAESF